MDILDFLIEPVRLLTALLLGGAVFWLLKGANKYLSFGASSSISLLAFHGMNILIRWYTCPLDLPLYCDVDCTMPVISPTAAWFYRWFTMNDSSYAGIWMPFVRWMVLYGGLFLILCLLVLIGDWLRYRDCNCRK